MGFVDIFCLFCAVACDGSGLLSKQEASRVHKGTYPKTTALRGRETCGFFVNQPRSKAQNDLFDKERTKGVTRWLRR